MDTIQWINWTHMGIPIKHERGNVVVRQHLNIVNSWSGWLHDQMQCVRKLQRIIWWASLFEWFDARDKPNINYFGISYFPNSNETHWTMNTSISCKLLVCSRSHSTFIRRHTQCPYDQYRFITMVCHRKVVLLPGLTVRVSGCDSNSHWMKLICVIWTMATFAQLNSLSSMNLICPLDVWSHLDD